MKRKFLLLILSIFLVGCHSGKTSEEKELELENGKTIKVNVKEKEVRENEKILVVNYQVEERIRREEIVEKQVLEIWKKLENLADEKEIEEGLINANYYVGEDENKKQPIYEKFLYVTEKIENGTWQIRKVN